MASVISSSKFFITQNELSELEILTLITTTEIYLEICIKYRSVDVSSQILSL